MVMTKQRRILVLDADMVPALTIVRSLRKRGCIIDTAAHIDNPITAYSNCVQNTFLYPDPLGSSEAFLDWLVAQTQAVSYDLVIPVTERSLVPISVHRHRFGHTKISMPSAASLELALDKEKTVALAEQVGVPVPRGVTINSFRQLDEYLPEANYPVVLKPSRSVASNNQVSSQLKVSYAFDETGLRSGCEHGLKFGPILLQEYFRGKGVGIELIARQGEIVYAFQHLRLHEVPLTGGGSSLRKSEAIEPKLLAASEQLIRALKWNGVAMVEFKWDPESETFCLMEINGRFWGSLPLADAAGADFPSMLLDLELDGEIGPHPVYRENIYCRKIASDFYWYEAVMRGVSSTESRIVDLPSGREVIRELGLLFLPRHYFDVQSLRDPMPGLVDIGRIVKSYIFRVRALVEERLFFWRQKRAWKSGQVAESVAEAKTMLFICYGNINRSALADVLIASYAEDSGQKVLSAGFHHEEGREADPIMVDVASERGVDLEPSRSVQVTAEMVESSDVIFGMEKVHIDRLQELGVDVSGKTWLLGAHARNSTAHPEIADPYGRARSEYVRCYNSIATAVDQIKSVLAYRRSD